MGKSYILAKRADIIRKIDCLDLKKVHFINKKRTPPLPSYHQQGPICKNISPTDTEASF